MKTIISLFFLLILEMNISSQTFSNYTKITYTPVCFNSVSIDSLGNFWLGSTTSGVIKFDGTKWTNYTMEDGLISNFINAVQIDSQGNLWVATFEGISKFDGIIWKTYTTNEGLIDNRVTSIAIDSEGNTWCCTELGLSKFNGSSWTNYPINEYRRPGPINSDDENNIWIGTDSALIEFDGEKNWIKHTLPNIGATNYITSISIDQNGNKWLGTDGYGILKFNSTWEEYSVENNSITATTIDSADNIWIATWGGCIWKFDGTNWLKFDKCIKNGYFSGDKGINAIAIDVNGNKWFISRNALTKFDDKDWTIYSYKGLNSNYVRSIKIDSHQNKWILTDTTITKFDGTNWRTYGENEIGSKDISCVNIDYQDNVWIGTYQGLKKFDGNNWTSYNTNDGLINDSVTCITNAPKNNVWIGTFNGVSKFDGANWTNYTIADGLEYKMIRAISVDSTGSIWLSFWNNGVAKFDGRSWTTYPTIEGIVKTINAISQDSRNNVWFGAKGPSYDFSDMPYPRRVGKETGGIFRFDGTNWTSYFPLSSGFWYQNELINLSSDYIYAITPDSKGNIWFGTYFGVTKFDGNDWTTYNTSLPYESPITGTCSVVTIAIDSFGNKWLGKNSGIVKIVDQAIEVIPKNITLPANENSTATFKILSNTSWNISTDQPWINLSNAKGSDTATVTIVVTENQKIIPRVAKITITNNNLPPKTITVIQEANSLNIAKASECEVKIYPNPVKDKLTISFSKSFVRSEITIYSSNGIPIYINKRNEGIVKINMINYLRGFYYIKVNTNNKCFVKKVIKL